MKPLFSHIGSGVAALLCAGLLISFWEWAVLEWVQKKELNAAVWLTLADFELTVATLLFLLMWFVTLFRGQAHYIRFRGCLIYYCYCVSMVLLGSLAPVALELMVAWLYSVRWWPVAAVFRFVGFGLDAAWLITVGIGIFVMVKHLFEKPESESV